MKIKKEKEYITFKQAVKQTPDVANGFYSGLEALGKYRTKIQATDEQLLNGSINIDVCTMRKYPDENRWDYAIAYNEFVYFVEVHPANTKEVSVVLKKRQWLKDWLNKEAKLINQLEKAQPAYYWIRSNNFNILKSSPQYRCLAQAKLIPITQLQLK